MEKDKIDEFEYRDEVESVAKTVISEYKEYDYGDINEAIWETVDGHQWIIYNGYNLDVIQSSATSLADIEWQVYVDFNDASYLDIFQAMAYALFEHDVAMKVQELRD